MNISKKAEVIKVEGHKMRLDKIKDWALSHPDYASEFYLCLIGESELEEGPFTSSWKQIWERETAPAYWGIYTVNQNGYKEAIKRYGLRNTKNSYYPKEILADLK